jgi:membrane protein
LGPDEAADRAQARLDGHLQLRGHGIGELLRETWDESRKHDLPGLAADISYHATFAVLPFLLFVLALPSVVATIFTIPDVNAQVVQKTDTLFSEDLSASVQSLLSEVGGAQGWAAVGLGFAGLLWAGSSTTATIRKAFNRFYGYEEVMPFLQRKLYEIALTLVAGVLALAALVLVVLGPGIVGEASDPVLEIVFLFLGLISILVTVSLIYWLAPAADNTFRWVTPGAALFAIVWLVFSFGFSAYLALFSGLNDVYGVLGAMLIVVIWLYWSSLALLVGAAINAALARRVDPNVSR